MKTDSNESTKQFQTQLQHFDAGLGRTELLAEHAGSQAAATQDFAKQAQRSANYAHEAIQEAIYAERPWMGGNISVSDFAEGKKPTFRITFTNSGKRPAIVDIFATRDTHQWASEPFPKDPFGGFAVDTARSKVSSSQELTLFPYLRNGLKLSPMIWSD